MASIAGLIGEPNLAVYSAKQGALISLTKALAIEWARYGVTVNALAPGYFRTDLNAAADNPEVADRLLKKNSTSPRGRTRRTWAASCILGLGRLGF